MKHVYIVIAVLVLGLVMVVSCSSDNESAKSSINTPDVEDYQSLEKQIEEIASRLDKMTSTPTLTIKHYQLLETRIEELRADQRELSVVIDSLQDHKHSSPAATEGKSLSWDKPPSMQIDENKDYQAVFELDKGLSFTVDLFSKKAPKTVNNFVFLSREGYYDGVTFHRVIEGFMAQGGDPSGTGMGGPGYVFDNEIHADLKHDSPGTLSMANSGNRNGKGTNGSQFFITFVATPPLDGHGKDCNVRRTSCHSVFGRVIEGMDVVNGISTRDPSTAKSPGDVINSIRIIER